MNSESQEVQLQVAQIIQSIATNNANIDKIKKSIENFQKEDLGREYELLVNLNKSMLNCIRAQKVLLDQLNNDLAADNNSLQQHQVTEEQCMSFA